MSDIYLKERTGQARQQGRSTYVVSVQFSDLMLIDEGQLRLFDQILAGMKVRFSVSNL